MIGKDDVQIRTKEDNIETISNVLYIPDLKCNLSVRKLQEKGYVVTIKGGCEIYDSKRGLIARAKMTPSMLFPL